MADEKIDYSKVKTHGGVATTADGSTHTTSLSDSGRAAQIQALKNERSALEGRGDDATAKRRLGEIDAQLKRFNERPARGERETA